VPTAIFRDEVRRLVEEGIQLVEVLPREEYEEEHLPGPSTSPSRSWTGRRPRDSSGTRQSSSTATTTSET